MLTIRFLFLLGMLPLEPVVDRLLAPLAVDRSLRPMGGHSADHESRQGTLPPVPDLRQRNSNGVPIRQSAVLEEI